MRRTDYDKEIGTAIKLAIQSRRGWTQLKVAKELGLSEDVMYNITSGKTPADAAFIARLRDLLEMPGTWLSEITTQQKGIQSEEQVGGVVRIAGDPRMPLSPLPLTKIPVIGEVAAGRGATNVDPDDGGVYVPERLARPDWTGMLVTGDSMMPHLEDGDVVVFKQESQPRSRFTYLVEKDREYRLKQVRWKDDRWFLHSTNPAYEDEPFVGWRILAMVVGVYRLRGTREKLLVDTEGLRFDED